MVVRPVVSAANVSHHSVVLPIPPSEHSSVTHPFGIYPGTSHSFSRFSNSSKVGISRSFSVIFSSIFRLVLPYVVRCSTTPSSSITSPFLYFCACSTFFLISLSVSGGLHLASFSARRAANIALSDIPIC